MVKLSSIFPEGYFIQGIHEAEMDYVDLGFILQKRHGVYTDVSKSEKENLKSVRW